VKRPNGEPISDVDITVTAAPVTLQLQPGPNGAPIQAIQTPAAAGATTPAPLTATTDGSGHVVFRGLAEGNYTVLARREGYFAILNDTYATQSTTRVLVGPPGCAINTGASGSRCTRRGGSCPSTRAADHDQPGSGSDNRRADSGCQPSTCHRNTDWSVSRRLSEWSSCVESGWHTCAIG
jgi:hypothetical protein